MPPAIRIEAKAWDDPRFDCIGKTLGIHRDLALILMGRVWSYQTEENARHLSPRRVDLIAGIDGFADAALTAELMEGLADGCVRPKGTDGRIEWLAEKRKNSRKGGRATKAKWGAKRRPIGPPSAQAEGEAERGPNEGPLALALALAPALAPSEQDPSGPEYMLAVRLRTLLIAEKPNHALSDEAAWRRVLPGWLRQARAALKKGEGRTNERAMDLLGYVFGDQGGTEYRFVVQSPEALGKKWDAIETRMAKASAKQNGRGGGLSARELWQWADQLEAEEKAGKGGQA